MIWSMLAFIAHAETLDAPEYQEEMDMPRIFGFAVRAVCLVAMSAIPCVMLLSTMTVSTDPDIAVGAFLVAIVPAFALAGILVFALFGTLLPAYVAGDCESLGDALRRGRQQFFWLAGRLALPACLAMLASALLVAPVVLFGIAGIFLSGGYVPNPLVMPFALVAYALLTLSIILTAVILSRAFLRDSETASATTQERHDVSVPAGS